MNYNQLRALIEVADCGSFSAAAPRLGVSQPAVSLRVQSLERAVGIKLFLRQGEAVTLTAAGRICYDVARQIVRAWDAVNDQLTPLRGQVAGKLTIGASTIPSEYILPAHLKAYREEHPLVSIVLRVGGSQDILEAVSSGAVDLGVIGSQPQADQLEWFAVADDELALIAPVGHPWVGTAIDPAEIAQEPLILREPGSGTRAAAIAALSALGVSPEALTIAGELGSHEAVVAAVEAGLGIAIVSSLAAGRAVADRRVALLDWPGAAIRRSFYCVTRRGAATAAAIALRDQLRKPATDEE
ncbi:MAG: selenium metabolism-associated LysR family transcriptional regulator [Chloroflexota bacterium]